MAMETSWKASGGALPGSGGPGPRPDPGTRAGSAPTHSLGWRCLRDQRTGTASTAPGSSGPLRHQSGDVGHVPVSLPHGPRVGLGRPGAARRGGDHLPSRERVTYTWCPGALHPYGAGAGRTPGPQRAMGSRACRPAAQDCPSILRRGRSQGSHRQGAPLGAGSRSNPVRPGRFPGSRCCAARAFWGDSSPG